MARLKNEDRISPGILSLAVCAGVLWTDLVIKQWAENALTEPVRITSWLCLAIQYNAGLFLGAVPVASMPVMHWLFLGAAILCLGWRMTRSSSLAIGVGYALITGGVMGNALDRINGTVVDFLGFGPVVDEKWAFANLADFAMLGGLLLLGVVLIRGRSWRSCPRDQGPKRPSCFRPDSGSTTSCDDSPNVRALAQSSRDRQ